MHLENLINQISDSETLVRAAIQTEDGSSQQPIPEQVHTLETPGDRRITDSPEKRFEYIEDSKVTTWYQYEIPAENLSGQNGKGKLLLESENNKLKTNPIPPKLVTGHEDSSVAGELQPAGVRRVAGLSDEKEQILDFLDNIPQEWGLTPETGLLLSGPPGTGKTQLVSEICEEIYGSIPVIISGPEILSRWVGESERILREKFEEARSRKGGVLYIDEIDSIARSRDGGGQDHTAQLVAQLLVLLDGVGDFDTADGETIQVIASTNMPHVLDPALTRPGRFGETVEFSKTDTETARAVLHHYLEEIRNSAGERQLSDPLLEFVRTGKWTLSELDSVLQNRTGADIEALVRQGVKSAAKDGQDELSVGDLKEASNELQGQTRIDYWSK